MDLFMTTKEHIPASRDLKTEQLVVANLKSYPAS
jgi:hypothetical protein